MRLYNGEATSANLWRQLSVCRWSGWQNASLREIRDAWFGVAILLELLYNRNVDVYVIGNPVPTPEELSDILELSPDRVKAVRRIMDGPIRAKKSPAFSKVMRKAAAKKASPTRTRRIAAKE